MRRFIFIIILISSLVGSISAQEKFIDHLAVGVTYGTTSMSAKRAVDFIPFGRQTDGVGLEADLQINSWLDARLGISLTPSGGGSATYGIEGVPDGRYICENIQLVHEYGTAAGNLFLDFYPFRKTAFHFTAGIYAGSRRLLHIYNETPVPDALAAYNAGVVEIHGLTIPVDAKGEIEATIALPAVRPYVGVGINTARLSNDNVYFGVDLGVMYKGNKGMIVDGPGGEEMEVDYWRSEHYLARMTAWNKKCVVAPLLSFHLFIRIF